MSRIRLGPGDRVGPYVVEEELSRGAMGIVLRAHPEGLPEQRVALKVLQARVSDEEGRARFQREGEAMARLSHPAVVKVWRLDFLPDGNPYLAMELVEGQDLEQSVGEEPVEIGEAARLVAGVAEGVAHLHGRGLIHRDLKLANVLLREGRQPVVADFGLVHFLDRQTRLTQAGDLIGTPLYMAPELVRGEAGVTPAADVYALGVMLYRLVAGRYPYEAATTEQLLVAILDEEPALDPAWPAPLRAVLGKALAYEPHERYPDAGALAADVLALHEGREVSARPPGLGRKLARLRRGLAKRPRLVRAFGILAVSAPLVAAGLLGYQWRADIRAQRESEDATREARKVLRDYEGPLTSNPRPWEPRRKRLEELKARLDSESDQARALAEVMLEVDQSVARAAVLEALAEGEGLAALAERAASLPLPADPSLPRAAAFCSARLELRLRTGDLEGALGDRQALGDLAGEGESVERLRSLYQTLERAQGNAPEAPNPLTAARWALDGARLQPPGAARKAALLAARPLLAAAEAEPGAVAAADPPSRPLPTLHQDVGRSLKLPPPILEVPNLEPLVAERALLALRAQALELEPGDRGGRSVILERLRRLRRDPRRAPPPRVLARSLLLEARLGLELGWSSGSLWTWRRARKTWVEEAKGFALAPAPALGACPAALLPFDLAARVGELCAASEGLEPERLERAARALVAEVGGEAYRAWREEAEAILAGAGKRPATPAGERRKKLDALAATASPQGVEASPEARRDLCLGEAEIAGAGRALWFERALEAEPCLERAERHLTRALSRGLPSDLTGRAWAGRALLALRRVQLGGAESAAQLQVARQALSQAKSHAGTSWEVRWAEAALSGVAAGAGQGSPEEAAEHFLRAAEAAGQAQTAPLLAVGQRHEVLVDGLLTLRGAPPLARAKLARALVTLAREVRLSHSEEASWLGVLARELRAGGQEAEAEGAEQERSQSLKAQKSLAKRYAKILGYRKDRPDLGTDAEKRENWGLIQDHPFAAGPLFLDYQRHRPLTPYAEDSLAVAFAVRPLEISKKLCGSICYATVTRKSAHLGAPVSATRALRRLADFGPPNPLGLKVAPPPALLRALLHFEILALGDEMDPGVRGRALRGIEAALWESPRSQGVALLEAWVRAGLGDGEGAREALRRARWLGPTCSAPSDEFEEAVVTHFVRARTYAVEGRYDEAVTALRPLRGKRGLTSEWLYWERDFRIQRERWATFPPALVPVYNSLLAEEATRRR